MTFTSFGAYALCTRSRITHGKRTKCFNLFRESGTPETHSAVSFLPFRFPGICEDEGKRKGELKLSPTKIRCVDDRRYDNLAQLLQSVKRRDQHRVCMRGKDGPDERRGVCEK